MADAEIRFQWYDVTTDLTWREMTTTDVEMLNAAREAQGLLPYQFVSWHQDGPGAPGGRDGA